MGYTKIVGTPVVTGLYTILLPVAVFAWLGSSRHLVVGADSATAAMLFAGLSGLAVPFSPHWLTLTSVAALLTAIVLVAAAPGPCRRRDCRSRARRPASVRTADRVGP
jgi:MFS superfamily sulfate permease-like transporter